MNYDKVDMNMVFMDAGFTKETCAQQCQDNEKCVGFVMDDPAKAPFLTISRKIVVKNRNFGQKS